MTRGVIINVEHCYIHLIHLSVSSSSELSKKTFLVSTLPHTKL